MLSALLLESPGSSIAEPENSVPHIDLQLSRVDVAIASLKRAQSNLQHYRASLETASGKSGTQEAERRRSLLESLQGRIEASLRRSAILRRTLLNEPAPRKPEPLEPARPEPIAAIEAPEPVQTIEAVEPAEAAPVTEPLLGEPAPARRNFLVLSEDEQLDIVWELLLGQGALDRREAVRTVADGLRRHGLANAGIDLSEAIAAALQKGLQEGSFDRARRGTVRAVLIDPKDYQPEDWQRCLLAVLGPEPADIDEILRAAAGWAQETMGLEFARLRTGGVILTGLRTALDELIEDEIVSHHGTQVWHA